MSQYDLDGNPVRVTVGIKDGPRPRQYVFPPEVITFVNSAHLATGMPKPEVVSTAIRLAAAIISGKISEEDLDKILSKFKKNNE